MDGRHGMLGYCKWLIGLIFFFFLFRVLILLDWVGCRYAVCAEYVLYLDQINNNEVRSSTLELHLITSRLLLIYSNIDLSSTKKALSLVDELDWFSF